MGRRRVGRPKGPGSEFGMPVSAWPEVDRLAWENSAVGDDSLDGEVDTAWMAANTRRNLTTAYARWLGWLKTTHPESLSWLPGERFSKEWVLDYLDTIRRPLKPSTVFVYACALRTMGSVISPATDRRWFQRIIDNLERRAHRQPRKRKVIIEIDRLFNFGINMMDTAGEDPEQSEVAVAEQFRDGLIFAFLAARPVRRSNMVGLRIGQEFVATHDGYTVSIAAESYKTDVPFEFPVPDRLVPYLRLYLDEYRRVLAAGGSPKGGAYLWLYRSGAPLTGDSLRTIIGLRSEQGFGTRLNPHDFRHCAASSIVLISPDEWPIIKIILGHSSLRTAEGYYLYARGIGATMAYQNAVGERQKQATRNSSPRRD